MTEEQEVSEGCVFCSAPLIDAAGWTTRTLPMPILWVSQFDHGVTTLPAGDRRLCPTCEAWMVNPDGDAPAAVAEQVSVHCAKFDSAAVRAALREELIGLVTTLAAGLQSIEVQP